MRPEDRLDLLFMPSSRNLEAHAVVTLERGITVVRWLCIAIAAVAVFLLYPDRILHPLWAVIAAGAAYNACFQFFVIPRRPQWLLKGYMTIIGDVVFTTAAVVATGGIDSEFHLAYFLVSVLAAVRFSQKAAVVATLATLVSYLGMVVLSSGMLDLRLLAVIFLRVGFVAVAALFAGYVANRSRRAQQSLATELDEARQALARAAKAMYQTLELPAVAKAVAQSARELLDADIAYLHAGGGEGAGGRQEVMSTTEKGATLAKLLDGAALARIASGLVEPVALDPSAIRSHLGLDPEDIRFSYVICCPLRFEQEDLGLLALVRLGPPEPLSDLRRNVLAAFLDRAAVALAHAQVYTRIQYQAYTDSLTGLPNHRAFKERFTAEWKRCAEAGLPMSLLMIDINDFKLLNDTLGHAAGDTLLKEMGRVLHSVIAPGDMAARYGGDEFVVLLPGREERDARHLAQALVARVRESLRASPGRAIPFDLSISVGVACYPHHGSDRVTLLTNADLAMYMAKNLGKNQIYSAEELGKVDPVGQILARFVERMAGGSVALGPGVSGELEKKLRLAAQLSSPGNGRGARREPDHVTFETICALAAAVDAKDPYTENHSRNVAAYATALARRLGFDEDSAEKIRWAALMHDIGKIGIPDAILRKPGPLTPDEMRIMQQHASIGARIVSQVQSLQPLVPLIRHHHEAYDGSGYPDGLAGEAIPLGARILAVCDAFDAITSDRPYRSGRPLDVALAIIEEGRGRQFDPELVDAFLAVVGELGVLSARPPGGPPPQPPLRLGRRL